MPDRVSFSYADTGLKTPDRNSCTQNHQTVLISLKACKTPDVIFLSLFFPIKTTKCNWQRHALDRTRQHCGWLNAVLHTVWHTV